MVRGELTLVDGTSDCQPCFSAATRSSVFLHTYVTAPVGSICRNSVICFTWKNSVVWSDKYHKKTRQKCAAQCRTLTDRFLNRMPYTTALFSKARSSFSTVCSFCTLLSAFWICRIAAESLLTAQSSGRECGEQSCRTRGRL